MWVNRQLPGLSFSSSSISSHGLGLSATASIKSSQDLASTFSGQDCNRRLLRKPPLDVQVVDVNRRSDRNLVAGQLIGVVQARPGVFREDLGGGAMRVQPRKVLPHPTEHMLRREVTLLGDLGGHRPL